MAAKMNNDTKWLIGTGVVLAGLLSAQMRGTVTSLSNRIEDLNTSLSSRMDRMEDRFERRFEGIENRFDGLEERLRAVEMGLGKLDQRLLTIERVVLPGNEQPEE